MFHPARFHAIAPLAAALLGLAAFGAQAQSVTSIVVAFPPGGPADSLARVVATQLEKELKQTVVIENKPGGNGAIAASQVARSRPDGHTLFLSSVGAISINPALYPKLIYDPIKDFAPVSLLVSTPEVLVVGPGSASKTARDFVANAKSAKGATMASSGVGSMPHMAIVQLKLSTKANILHVPYKGAAPAITDTIGGQVDGFIGDISGLMSTSRRTRSRRSPSPRPGAHPCCPRSRPSTNWACPTSTPTTGTACTRPRTPRPTRSPR